MNQSDNRGFQVFALDSPQALRTIRTKLESRRIELVNQLTIAQDWSDYRHRVGVLQGIDEALQVCDAIEAAERA